MDTGTNPNADFIRFDIPSSNTPITGQHAEIIKLTQDLDATIELINRLTKRLREKDTENERLNKMIDVMAEWIWSKFDCDQCPLYDGENCGDRHDPRLCDDAIKAYFAEKVKP